MKLKLFLDECGYTGEDLLNKDQPIFTLGSILLEEHKCRELKNEFYKNVKSQELKHTKLVKYPNQRKMVVDFIKEVVKKPELIKLSVSDKKFVLVTKMVDWIIEPPMYDNGIDLYLNGGNIALSNYIYFTFKQYANSGFFNSVLKLFQKLMRKRDLESYHQFFSLFYNNLPKEVAEIAIYFKYWYEFESLKSIKTIPENDLNISFTNTLYMMALWSKDLKYNVNLIHDSSSNMSKYKELWDLILCPDNDSAKIGYDIRTIEFPLKISKTLFENSINWTGLQLADILAGAVNYMFKRWIENDMDEYADEIFNLIKDGIHFHSIVPEYSFTPEELGTIGKKYIDPNNYLGKMVSKYFESKK